MEDKKHILSTVSLGLSKNPEPSFKSTPKRIKISKIIDVKKGEEMLARQSRAASTSADSTSSGKKRLLKPRTQLSPLKYKKSLEKRRTGDKKAKILYKKASKLAVSSTELSKVERKRRSILP